MSNDQHRVNLQCLGNRTSEWTEVDTIAFNKIVEEATCEEPRVSGYRGSAYQLRVARGMQESRIVSIQRSIERYVFEDLTIPKPNLSTLAQEQRVPELVRLNAIAAQFSFQRSIKKCAVENRMSFNQNQINLRTWANERVPEPIRLKSTAEKGRVKSGPCYGNNLFAVPDMLNDYRLSLCKGNLEWKPGDLEPSLTLHKD